MAHVVLTAHFTPPSTCCRWGWGRGRGRGTLAVAADSAVVADVTRAAVLVDPAAVSSLCTETVLH